LPVFSFSPNGYHPYVRAILVALKSPHKKSKECIAEILSEYYNLVQPASAASVLNLNDKDISEFDFKPSWAAIMPWEKKNLDEWCIAHHNSVFMENQPYKRGVTINDGWAWVGPVSESKLKIEVQRLDEVFNSILRNKYNRHDGNDGDILAIILVEDDGGWCWQAISGQHRVSVLSGMGIKEVSVRIVRIIFRRDVSSWVQVKSGLYSEETALRVFDNVFSGNNFKIAKKWEEYIKNSEFYD